MPVQTEIIDFIKENNWWISILVAIFVGILVNLVSPSIRELIRGWWTTRTLSTSQKRLKQLETRLEYITNLYQDRDKFLWESVWVAFRVLLNLSLASVMHSFTFIFSLGFIFALPAALESWRYASIVKDVIGYDEFKSASESEIERLRQKIEVTTT